MGARVQLAREFAIQVHENQRYGSHPYSYHLDAVAKLVESFGEEFQVAAFLHDTLEDTETTIEQIESSFGLAIAECVSILTDEPGENRKIQKQKTNAKLASTTNTMALTVKAADRLANLLESNLDPSNGILQMYRQEHLEFRQAVYRGGICDDLWQEIEYIIHGAS